MNEEFEKMRAEFEAWYAKVIGNTASLTRADAYYGRPTYGDAKIGMAWDAWQASRKQALEECLNGVRFSDDLTDAISAIRALTSSKQVSVSSLLKHEGAATSPESVPSADVDQFVAPATVRADEVNAEIVDAGLNGVEGNFDAAADADPHGHIPSKGADIHHRQAGCGIQAALAVNTPVIAAKSAGNITPATTTCHCHTCRPITMADMRMILCPTCGNKRCPHANDHRNVCTGSNEPGQPGSAYPSV